jgi:hypothetical protein
MLGAHLRRADHEPPPLAFVRKPPLAVPHELLTTRYETKMVSCMMKNIRFKKADTFKQNFAIRGNSKGSWQRHANGFRAPVCWLSTRRTSLLVVWRHMACKIQAAAYRHERNGAAQGPDAACTAPPAAGCVLSQLYSSRLGVPGFRFCPVTLFSVAEDFRTADTSLGVAPGLSPRYVAATPAGTRWGRRAGRLCAGRPERWPVHELGRSPIKRDAQHKGRLHAHLPPEAPPCWCRRRRCRRSR